MVDCLSLPLDRVGVCGWSLLLEDPPAPLRPLRAGDAGGELVVELVAEVLELLLALPFLPRASSSVCVAA